MTDKELNIVLRDMARKAGACQNVMDEWGDEDTVDILLDRYMSTLDFAIDKDFPTVDFVDRHFRKEDLHRHHIYANEEVDISGDDGVYVLLGSCTGAVRFVGTCVATVYVRHDSHVSISSSDGSIVFVRLYEHCSCEKSCDRYSKLSILDRRERK